MKRSITVPVILLGLLLMFSPAGVSANATEEGYYKVLVGANLRRTPSIEGAIVTVVREGEVVYYMGNRAGEYSFVRFGDIEGYIVSGVIGEAMEEKKSGPIEVPAAAAKVAGRIAEEDAIESAMIVEAEEPEETDAEEIMSEDMSGAVQAIDEEKRIALQEEMAGTAGTSAEAAEADPAASASRRALRISMGMKISDDSRDLAEKKAPVRTEGYILALVNFRAAADVKSEKIGMLRTGEKVTVLEGGNDEFARVRYGDTEGYIYKQCIRFTDVEVPEEQEEDRVVRRREATSAMLNGLVIGAYEQEALIAAEEHREIVKEAIKDDQDSLQAEVASMQISAKNDMKQSSKKKKTGTSVAGLNIGGDPFSMTQYNGLSGMVIVDNNLVVADPPSVSEGAEEYEITAYCTCRICCGNFSPEVTGREAHTATGTVPVQGRTIAVDPSVIPYGSTVVIDGLGTFIAEDTGGAIRQKRIDVYFETHEDALAFGRQYRKVEIIR